MKKKNTYNGKAAKDLQKELAEKREAVQAFKFNISGSRTTNVKEARNTRRTIARILTALNAGGQNE
ncbi:MAG TPA: 50S ribosomal protein L29 [Candidatus Paceibacterota bacterium]|nr:50S ribosomal protein L29 [Candidatus Paceibacterota bacterium]